MDERSKQVKSLKLEPPAGATYTLDQIVWDVDTLRFLLQRMMARFVVGPRSKPCAPVPKQPGDTARRCTMQASSTCSNQEQQQPPRQEVMLGTTTAADNIERHHTLDAGARADHGGDLPVFLRDEWTLPNESEEAERTDHLQARFPALPRPVVQHALREHRGHAGHTAAALGVPACGGR